VTKADTRECPYCGFPPCDEPEIEDDWGRLMCAPCFIDGEGRSQSYMMEGVRIFEDPPEPVGWS
jgi:hypothetical protein